MEATWKVNEVRYRPGRIMADLERVEWFKTNPEYIARQDEVPGDDFPDEFIEALPGDTDAEFNRTNEKITLDITDGDELTPDDDVIVTLRVATHVDA